ncbi:hypothetical protein MSAN_01645700 [Mycena sanguinolenta]|uniref:Uncharacterized protein n=1 Tax=Mycena sanguinolenta TaxID=230812 RepID=A0A8H6Y188_9AGAR|nr:hypothetical protein MSAN_01645700 [Mycena sanguinolenta]
MFSKVFALGLGALALVRAAPAFSFQTPMLSCSANFDTSVAAIKSNAIEEGFYQLYNEAWDDKEAGDSQLRGFGYEPIYVSYSDDNPGPFGVWHIKPSGIPDSNEYKIINHGQGRATDVSQACYRRHGMGIQADLTRLKDRIVIGHDESGTNFAIEPAGDGLFTVNSLVFPHSNFLISVPKIKVPNEDLVWTVDTPDINLLRSDVYLRPQTGAREAKWKVEVSTYLKFI